jgi:hypothetical protein
MEFKSSNCLIGKREVVALSVAVCVFAALLTLQCALWSFFVVAVLFVGYASWSTTAYLANQDHFSRRSITACIWPVGIAMLEALISLGLGWLIVWLAHRIFGS